MSLILEGEGRVGNYEKHLLGQLVSWSLCGSSSLFIFHLGKIKPSADDKRIRGEGGQSPPSALFCFQFQVQVIHSPPWSPSWGRSSRTAIPRE